MIINNTAAFHLPAFYEWLFLGLDIKSQKKTSRILD
jgi:hypothetical protein